MAIEAPNSFPDILGEAGYLLDEGATYDAVTLLSNLLGHITDPDERVKLLNTRGSANQTLGDLRAAREDFYAVLYTDPTSTTSLEPRLVALNGLMGLYMIGTDKADSPVTLNEVRLCKRHAEKLIASEEPISASLCIQTLKQITQLEQKIGPK